MFLFLAVQAGRNQPRIQRGRATQQGQRRGRHFPAGDTTQRHSRVVSQILQFTDIIAACFGAARGPLNSDNPTYL